VLYSIVRTLQDLHEVQSFVFFPSSGFIKTAALGIVTTNDRGSNDMPEKHFQQWRQ
jgi:hypothetical protein